MPKRILKAIGGLKPWKPKKSLPSYSEPTPETTRKLTREHEAELALSHTVFTPGTPLFLVVLFLGTIASVPVIQLAVEMRAHHAGDGLPMLEVFKAFPSAGRIAHVRSLRDFWNLLPHAHELKSAEKALESDSVVSQWLLPPVQSLLIGHLRAANEQVYLGRDGWLFYRPDVDYVTGPPFLDGARLKQRTHAARIQPDPVKAITQFREQLAARGIELVLLPVPTKASLEGSHLSTRAETGTLLENSSFAEFQSRLRAAGVRVFDPEQLLLQRKAASPDAPLYLETDTHWRPETMERVAQQLASALNLVVADNGRPPQLIAKQISALGDIERMLKLPEDQRFYAPQAVTVHQVMEGDTLWRPTRDADVLLLGDSFANIFSLDALGWGESAGFAEHLSVALGGRPIDCILRNSDSAFATREILSHELARGRDRLSGKKLVIWEFAARELAFGNWKLMEMNVGTPLPSRFYSPKSGHDVEVTGTIESVSAAPRPGTVPYADHVVAAHLVDLKIADQQGREESLEALVYLTSMTNNEWTPAARLRPGDRVTLRLRAWSDAAGEKEQINRSELDDPALQLEEPVWGELMP